MTGELRRELAMALDRLVAALAAAGRYDDAIPACAAAGWRSTRSTSPPTAA